MVNLILSNYNDNVTWAHLYKMDCIKIGHLTWGSSGRGGFLRTAEGVFLRENHRLASSVKIHG